MKDLVDLALLIGSGELDQERIQDALRLTFERRETHDLPTDAGPRRRRTGRSRFRRWRGNVASRPRSPQCLRRCRRILRKYWHTARSGERA